MMGPPEDINDLLPRVDLLKEALYSNVLTLHSGTRLVRSAWVPAAVFPTVGTKCYRFGPPEETRDGEGKLPWFWWYAASRNETALWEAQFCRHDARQPGTFYLAPGCEKALIATFELSSPIKLFDLLGTMSSMLGIFDQISSPDHEWCQWFGWMINSILQEQATPSIHGFRYPSRKFRGFEAYAFSSHFLNAVRTQLIHIGTETFGDTQQYQELLHMPGRVDRPQ